MPQIELKAHLNISPEILRRQEQRTLDAIERGVVRTVELGESVAKKLAPVRKVSEITRRKQTRSLTRSEIRALPARIRRSLSPDQLSRLQTTTRRARQELEGPRAQGRIARLEVTQELSGRFRLKDPQGESFLTQRGRAELREAGVTASFLRVERRGSGGKLQVIRRGRESAIYRRASGRATLGGRLRDEIRFRSLETRGGRIRYRLESPTPYAEYVEFPTSRTAAQPYMRPAREAMKKVLRRNIVREVERVGWRVKR